jgi:ankyrin repeat protein
LPLSSTSPVPTTVAAAAELVDAPSRPARALILPADDAAALALLQSPPPPLDRQIIVAELLRARRSSVVQRAVAQGVVDPNLRLKSRDGFEIPLIHMTAAVDAVTLLRFLVFERDVDPNDSGEHAFIPLHAAIITLKERAALFLIRDVPHIDINVRGRKGATALMLATKEGMVETMKALVAKGAQVEAVSEDGHTALIYAAAEEQEDAALYLLEEAGAAWDVGGEEYNALSAAATHGLVRLSKAILRRMRAESMEEEAIVGHMKKAADHAAYCGHVAVLRLLTEEGLTLSDVNVKGLPLLNVACGAGQQEAAAFLIEQGCDPLAHDASGLMPHHAAAAWGHLALLQWLLQRCSIPVNTEATAPSLGAPALHIAAAHGHLETVQWLIGAKADPLRRAKLVFEDEDAVLEGRASDMAASQGHATVAAYLRRQEEAAKAAAREEQEAAARRARNEKRRQKQKRAKARHRQEQQQQEGCGEGEQKAGGDDSLVAAMAGLGVGGQQQQQQQQEDGGGGAGAGALAGLAAVDDFDDHAMAFDEGEGGGGSSESLKAAATAKEQQEEDGKGGGSGNTEAGAAASANSAPQPAIPIPMPVPAPAPERPPPLEEYLEAHAPEDLMCPISLQLLAEPVMLVADGITYSRAAIDEHFAFCRQRAYGRRDETRRESRVVWGGREVMWKGCSSQKHT